MKFLKFTKILCTVTAMSMIFGGCGAKDDRAVTSSQIAAEGKIDETISIITLGDNLMHMPVVNSGKKKNGKHAVSVGEDEWT